jgi:AcrR family transcriptional regulator
MTFPQAAKRLLRDTVFDAVDDLVRERGWAGTTMSDVAAAVGLSRQTLYNEFGSRPALAQAYVLREADLFLTSIEDAVRAHAGSAREALHAGVETFLTAAADEPFFKAITSSDDGGLLSFLTTRGAPVLQIAGSRLGALIAELWPQAAAADVERFADSAVRLCISHATQPLESAQAVADTLTRVLGPFLDEAVRAVGATGPA